MDLIAIQYLIALFAAIVGFFAALKPVRGFVVKCWDATLGRRRVKLQLVQDTRLAKQEVFEIEIRSALKVLLAEMKPNGSSSMRDAIDRIEERQDDFEAFLNAQLNIGNEAVFRTDAEGHVITNNRKHQNLTGFSMAQVEGDGWINVIHPNWRTKTHLKWHEAVSEGREFSEDIMYVTTAGEEYMVHVNAFRERDATGKIRGYLGIVTPLTPEPIICPHIGTCAAAAAGDEYLNAKNSG
jgi:PAS domain S-box-containing protein